MDLLLYLEMFHAQFTEEQFVVALDVMLQALERLVVTLLERLVRISVRIQVLGQAQLTHMLQELLEALLHVAVLEANTETTLHLVRIVSDLRVEPTGLRLKDLEKC